MTRLASWLDSHRRWVIALWLGVVVASLPLAAKQTDALSGGGFISSGSDSELVEQVISKQFEERNSAVGIAWKAPANVSPAELETALGAVRRAVGTVPDLAATSAAITMTRRQLSNSHADEPRLALMPLASSLPASELGDSASALQDALDQHQFVAGIRPYLIGYPVAQASQREVLREDLAQAEILGFPMIAFILLMVFGSLAAAALPLALGFVSITVTGALIYLLAQQMEISVYATNLASMIGIGVAVDYSLFVVARYRQELAAGQSASAARARALATSGKAVTFSGLAVIICMFSLWTLEVPAMQSMALGAMIVVAIAVLGAVTLLPALLGLLEKRLQGGDRPVRFRNLLRRPFARRRPRPGEADFWASWTGRVMARPWFSLGIASLILLALAAPALDLKTEPGASDELPADHPLLTGTMIATAAVGGSPNPLQVLFQPEGAEVTPDLRRAVQALTEELERLPAVVDVDRPDFGDSAVLIGATSRFGSESPEALQLVRELRTEVLPGSDLSSAGQLALGGTSAWLEDGQEALTGGLWKVVAAILALTYIALLLLLRSVILPLKAILMNLLAVAASYGVLTVFFQWGPLGTDAIDGTDALKMWNLSFILAIVFGLSMDYEVFLLSRIRERYDRHGDNKRAVAEGLASSAPIISAAALIMVVVFATFVLTSVPSIEQVGVGTAVAVALDATLVRLVLVPATMQLLGDWNWWLPGWLDRVLPRFAAEAELQPARRID